FVLTRPALYDVANRLDGADCAYALPRRPDITPSFDAAIDVHAACSRRQVRWIVACSADRTGKVVAGNAAEEVRVDNIAGFGSEHHLLVLIGRIRLRGDNERRADIGKIGAHCPGGEDAAPVRDRA